ncbi:phage protein [Streptococcus dysgalactiae subsp. dysgalactiae]|uniref:Phage protein n=1 Tax=Streptococcus dysgalactiae subsp. dysgalactiae TaxID=99822 RepID=A0A380JVS8_STRDY|nr:hypothetical protein [Streptococcus dysgalactiae]SUN48905.1 phage protein [Streptococcus dysgalactiae subsp. dysgalactiae]
MAVQEIPDTYFYRLDSQRIDGNLSRKDGLVVDQFYIKIDDYDNFDADQDVDVYKIISSTQADVHKANKYNYQSLSETELSGHQPPTFPPPPPLPPTIAPKNDSLYQSITIDGRAIGRVICNNKVIWQNQGRSTSASGGWQQLWQGTLSLDDVRLPAYRTYLFKSDYDSFIRSATDLIGSYKSINGNTLIARYDHSNNQLLISGFGQNPVTIYGRN